MIKVSLRKVEKKLRKKLKHNSFCLGVDTAGTTGLAMITTTDTDLILEYDIFKLPVLPRKLSDQMIKAEKYEQQLDSMTNLIKEFKTKYRYLLMPVTNRNSILIIEQSYLGLNPEAYGILRAEQGLVYAILEEWFPTIKIWLATMVRKIVGFESNYGRSDLQHLKSAERTKIKKTELVKWVNNKLGIEIKDDNIADAIILALAGLVLQKGE